MFGCRQGHSYGMTQEILCALLEHEKGKDDTLEKNNHKVHFISKNKPVPLQQGLLLNRHLF